MKRLVFATNNEHKLQEARAILGDSMQLISLKEIGCHEEIPETQPTIEGNALQKARYVHEHYGVDCVADDTGLMVDALDGAPGVHSARYAGPGHDSQANTEKLLKEMNGVDRRDAHFSTVLALVTDKGEHTFEGRVDGSIATEPSGEGGFGYDPVFIAKETGRTFAEMDPEAKNAISHRGRAFRIFRDWLSKMTVIILTLAAGLTADAAQWRQHMSYDGNTLRIIESPDYTYFIPLKQQYLPTSNNARHRYGQLYRYDKENDEWKWLNAINGLSESIVASAAYDFKNNLLAIGYDNGNIDLLHDDGTKVNVPGLKAAGSNASPDIVDMNFDESDGDLWIATATGYVRVDPVKGEVVTSRNYGREVRSVAKIGDILLVATPEGLLYGNERSGDTGSFKAVANAGDKQFLRLIPMGDRVYGQYYKSYGNNLAGYIVLNDGAPRFIQTSTGSEYSLERGKDCIVTSGRNGARHYDRSGNIRETPLPSAIKNHNPEGASLDGKTWWFSAGRLGYSRMTLPDNGAEWAVTMCNFFPDAATAFKCVAMEVHPEYGLMIRNHGFEQGFAKSLFTTPDLICALRDGEWKPLSIQYTDRSPVYDKEFFVNNPMGLAIDPKNTNHIYCGSNENGLFRLNLENPSESLRIGRVNDAAVGMSGFIPVTEVMKVWDQSCCFSTPVFDADGTLWVSFLNTNSNKAELWYWEAADRLASTSSADYRPMKKMIFNEVVPSGDTHILPLSTPTRLVFHTSKAESPIIVLDHNGTLDNTADDVRRSITELVDQDGTKFNYGNVNSLYEDPSTGRVWVACSQGVFNFSPTETLKGNNSVRRVKVDRNDGTNLADLLLDGANVTRIVTDPSGKKWFATLGAGIVVTSPAGTEVLNTYTSDNSELPDNEVHGICYNPANRSMMISTGKGLCELFLTDSEISGETNVRAYPNPVRPNFLGNVTIDMLPNQATVKITDTNGRLVRELGTANGGEIVWDLTNSQRKRVPGGIYYVLAGNGHDQESFSKMTKILVVE